MSQQVLIYETKGVTEGKPEPGGAGGEISMSALANRSYLSAKEKRERVKLCQMKEWAGGGGGRGRGREDAPFTPHSEEGTGG